MKKFLRSIPCPTCGAGVGEDCSNRDPKLKMSLAHRGRWDAWDSQNPHLGKSKAEVTLVTYGRVKKKKAHKRPAKGGTPKISKLCLKGSHVNCYAINCICGCHGQYKVR